MIARVFGVICAGHRPEFGVELFGRRPIRLVVFLGRFVDGRIHVGTPHLNLRVARRVERRRVLAGASQREVAGGGAHETHPGDGGQDKGGQHHRHGAGRLPPRPPARHGHREGGRHDIGRHQRTRERSAGEKNTEPGDPAQTQPVAHPGHQRHHGDEVEHQAERVGGRNRKPLRGEGIENEKEDRGGGGDPADGVPQGKINENDLLIAESETGICRVVNFSPKHDVTLAEMKESEIEDVITIWQHEFKSLGEQSYINYVQIFENKGSIMGNSNPHPHGQIWAQESIPREPAKELRQFKLYYKQHKRNLLLEYLKLEQRAKERLVYENESFVILVPFWATWPYETIIIPRRRIASILELKTQEVKDYANALSILTIKYDNLFHTSFPYSSGLHQAPTTGKVYKEWQFHMHFYPPLLRSASIKKFMVGYEMLAEPQRDITPEYSAHLLRTLSTKHYRKPEQ